MTAGAATSDLTDAIDFGVCPYLICPAVAVNPWTMAKPIIPLETRTKAIDAGQGNKPAPRRSRNARDGNDDTEALRRRVEELENALMREVVEVVKRPRCMLIK